MQVVFKRCAGVDIHKATAVVCVLKADVAGPDAKQVRTFGTTTQELLRLRDWLQAEGVTHVAIESTGVYWRPVYNILEGSVEVWLVNAQEVRHLPGRKTDVQDSEWLADLLMHGLVKRSFVPDRPQRELRDLTRYRTQIIAERSSEVNRLDKMLQSANLKLSSVLSDVIGVSGRAILDAMVAGETDPEKLADLAVKRVRETKRTDLVQALDGYIGDHQRFMLKVILKHIDDLDRLLKEIEQQIGTVMHPFEDALGRLDEIPGIARRAAQVIIAEIGTDMSRFPSAEHLASWAGMCPGNNQSGGRRRSGKTRKGSPWLRSVLVEAAWAAARTRSSYQRTRYFRIRGRRGPKKAAIAVGHALIVCVYHLLRYGTRYRDLGIAYFDTVNQDRIVDRLTKRLQRLGYHVQLTKESA
jgi:transposase